MQDLTAHRYTMAGFKNRYLVMEVFLDPNKEWGHEDPILLTNFNVTKAIKESIFSNFGECGLGSALGSFQGHCNLYSQRFLISVFLYIFLRTLICFNCSVFYFLIWVVKYVNRITKVCIIRISRDEHQKIWSAITMVRSIGGCPVVFNLLDLSGKLVFFHQTLNCLYLLCHFLSLGLI